jgi:hypothetical protein
MHFCESSNKLKTYKVSVAIACHSVSSVVDIGTNLDVELLLCEP